jgi:hypothetical protein
VIKVVFLTLNNKTKRYVNSTVYLNLIHGSILIFVGFILILILLTAGDGKNGLIDYFGGGHPLAYSAAYIVLGALSLVLSILCLRLVPTAFLLSAFFAIFLMVLAALAYLTRAISFDPIDLIEIPLDILITFTSVMVYNFLRNRREVGNR